MFAFKELSKTVPVRFQCMLDYLEEFYIGKLIGKSKNNRQGPLFPIAIWNVHDRVMNDNHRTNNSLESWHKQFEADLDMKHPTINRLIEAFRKEQRNTEMNYIQLTGGLACPADQVAYQLITLHAIKQDDLIAICVDRNNEHLVIGIMAILKAGGAYLPIDPWYTNDIVKFILDDS